MQRERLRVSKALPGQLAGKLLRVQRGQTFLSFSVFFLVREKNLNDVCGQTSLGTKEKLEVAESRMDTLEEVKFLERRDDVARKAFQPLRCMQFIGKSRFGFWNF